ncbi:MULTISPECIES: NAD-glutamate dehydrogenase [unclassified Undibacterium]|uniref:NAD-glutamate dehydrogenase n=1 Tax=unclassified Undibacterium TaxID=2630295 RepID=UPI002AC9B20D|nr:MULTISPECIES: NAD-glutamate dehydrogenase [unclassified Undibacterium]MEB0138867.1 NAD-glutamate dehydrogenase [Undibacterium sp. CCC2.1]MEB0172271.1 NAD-glutamate dehydrogenase [Undibacterium sp. CCC1.1]MEB0176112.1 NAD-glutamate dehydrogenase [Undibacterium sp. CCC3.4]MEB0215927.1 NAD-glutamate dehydrogenase [Undibacterium sp. 5I2]WPX44747.1 NAD-glutamate dehydrogenase [Undibacterium sp. CCC3.4]
MTITHFAELLAYAQAHPGPAAERQGSFLSTYFDHTDPDEIIARGPATLFAQANAHWRLLDAAGTAGSARIRVFNPTLAEDGFVSEHTVVQIVNENMPFLVDSVTMAINRSGRTAHWIVHPLMSVSRKAGGDIAAVSTVAAAKSAGRHDPVESLIMVECDRIVNLTDQQALAAELHQVLVDVSSAVADWPAMLERVHSVCSACETHAPAECGNEGVAFLRWLEDRHFTFLGARDYDLKRDGEHVSLVAIAESGLGILRGKVQTSMAHLPPEVLAIMESDETVLVTKAMTRSTVHRPAWLDYVAIKRYDDSGKVIGESRFMGLYTSAAYAAPVDQIPQVRQRVAAVMASAGVVPQSHAAKALQAILDDYPRDELFQIDTATLTEHAIGILRLQERQRTRLFLRRDPFGRFTSAQVFVPRDRYNTELRVKVSNELMIALNGESIEFTPMLTDSPLARIHYQVRAKERAPQNINLAALEARVARLAQRWEDDCTTELLRTHGEGLGLALAHRFANAFPTAYREDFSALVGAEDAEMLAGLCATAPMVVKLYRPLDADAGMLRFKIYNTSKVALSDSLPVLEHMGARVLDEHPYQITAGSEPLWIHDLGLQLPPKSDLAAIKARFETLFSQAWRGEVESDDLNRLVLNTALDARSIAVLRACSRYFKQLGFAYSQSYIETALNKNAGITQLIAELFGARFKPDFAGDRASAQQHIAQQLEAQLAQVASLDEDRILRQFFATIMATLRTNLWQTDASGAFKPYMSFKLNPREVPGVPEPKPLFEIWVYSPRVEGVHLRGGKVARGGLRWSDRREDFRTEVLGLVKAQQVKNTVIVPVGSKGGFVLKNAPPATEREAFQAEGIACYKIFLSGLLDITDNIVKGSIVAPAQVVRHDADDPYLVVAADKGTATFSDIANSVSADYGFWLGDAFASGGSVGYDHKKMGITARGAWESVKRHFRSVGVNTQETAFSVAGIGDMSGDVFGNGMLLSEHIELVAAFDHRHIFIDPSPDAAASFAERQRLFNLPRSSWDDYDKSLISAGGGVYLRGAKSIKLSEQARAVLGISQAELTPVELLRVILQAPVDLLYNGGIGTYVKATFESHAQVGDKAGDAFRVNGNDLRCKVLAEGGNLGCTQNGRIEFAQKGGRIYTDAIDNSAGVDCSDHEVNIKILLGAIVEAGDLTLKQRNDLLASMTDEVGHLVLTDNYYQSQALDIAVHRPLYVLDGQQRLMQSLEKQGRLNRAIEYLPSDDEIFHRKGRKQGLTAPEGAVVLAYAKMSVFDDLVASNLPDDPFFSSALKAYFPQVLSERFPAAIAVHPLKREIVATYITNTVLNRVGATFVNFIATEAAAGAADVIRAFTLAREIFDLEVLWDQIDVLDYVVDATLQLDLLSKLIAITQRASRWMLRIRAQSSDLPTLIQRYQPAARELRSQLNDWLPPAAYTAWQNDAATLAAAGVETSLAQNLSALEYLFPALDLVDLAALTGSNLEQVARSYFGVDDALGLSGWRSQINRLPTETLWQTQARGSARDDVYSIATQITRGLLSRQEELSAWHERNAAVVERLTGLLALISAQAADLAPVSVALRELRQLA